MPLLARRRRSPEAVLDREYAELRGPTLAALRGKLAGSGLSFDDADLDAFYNQAWHGLYLRLAEGETVENHGGFLVQAGYRRAIEEVRRLHPERRADADLAAIGTEPDLAAQLDDHARLRHFMEGMREHLSERERQAVTLTYIHGHTRPEAAEILGVSPQRMEKLMDGATKKVGAITKDIDDGTWCEAHQSLVKAYAFGVLDPDGERYALAEAHLADCPGCRKYVRGLRGVASVTPPIWLPLAALGALGLGGAHAAAASGGAAAAGAGGGGGAGAGAGGGAAAGAGGGLGTAGIAAAASIAVAAGGFGAYKAATSGEDKPATTTTPPAKTAPPPAATQAVPAPPKPKATATPKPKTSATTTTRSATTPASAPATTTPAATTPATTTTTTPAPTTDGEQEFGFEH